MPRWEEGKELGKQGARERKAADSKGREGQKEGQGTGQGHSGDKTEKAEELVQAGQEGGHRAPSLCGIIPTQMPDAEGSKEA